MKNNSFFRNVIIIISCVICIVVLIQFTGCYSFTGGSKPDHLNTMFIAPVGDNSGYGDPRYREFLNQQLLDKFRNDNSFNLVDKNPDARLNVSISSIRDEILSVKPGELETERKVVVTCDVEYIDAVKKVVILKKSFTNFNEYSIANAQTERPQSIQKALEQTAEDILLSVVSGW